MAIHGRLHDVPVAGQVFHDDLARYRLVLDHQHPERAKHGLHPRLARGATGPACARGQPDAERRPLSGLALDVDRAVGGA